MSFYCELSPLSKRIPRVILLLVGMLFFVAQQALAHNNVVVIPMVGNGSNLQPISTDDLIEKLGVFTHSTNKAIFGTVTDERGIILTKITVAPERYPGTLAPISLRFCRESGVCFHSYAVPNNTISTIDFGLGDLFSSNGTYYIDLTSRGGLPENVSNQIIIHISGYYYDK